MGCRFCFLFSSLVGARPAPAATRGQIMPGSFCLLVFRLRQPAQSPCHAGLFFFLFSSPGGAGPVCVKTRWQKKKKTSLKKTQKNMKKQHKNDIFYAGKKMRRLLCEEKTLANEEKTLANEEQTRANEEK